MKNIFKVLTAVVIIGAVGYFGYGMMKKSGGSVSKLGLGDSAWKFDKTISEPIKSTVDATKEAVLGDLEKNLVLVSVPAGAFTSNVEVSLANPESVPDYASKEVETIGAPIEISIGKPTRLDEPAKITFKMAANQIPVGVTADRINVAYFSGERWEYLKPLSVDLATGLITFETYHFSLFGANKIADETVLTERWVHSKSLDNHLKKEINKTSDYVAKQIIDISLEKMGISDKTIKGKVLGEVLKNDAYKEVYDKYKKGDVVGMNEKIALIAAGKIAENVPKSALQAGLATIVKGSKDVAAVSQAAGFVAEGRYKDATKIIGEQIADKFVIVTAGKVAVEAINAQIGSWKNAEVEAAYTAFQKGANGKFWGYNNDKGDFGAVWDQMRGVRRQIEIDAIKKENAARVDSGMEKLTTAQEERVREDMKESYRQQFEDRSKQEAAIKDQEDKLKLLVESFKKNNLFDATLGPVGLDKGLDFENKLDVLYHFAEKMMADTNRAELSELNGLIMDGKISVDDIAMGARLYFGKDGKNEYRKFLNERFGIPLFPALTELSGDWAGATLRIDDITGVPEKPKETAPKTADPNDPFAGCDFNIDLNQLKGKEVPLAFTVSPSSETNGNLIITPKDSKKLTIPFTYTDGKINASYEQQGAVMTITLSASEDAQNYSINGPIVIEYNNGAIKIITSVKASRPIKK
ncbi:MAG: hypothetical protein WCJ29_02145 [bacterium]